MKFIEIDSKEQKQILQQVQIHTDLDMQVIEKDWWVTQVLHALFSLHYAANLSFKGGTSLSKCYNLIERFSEDVDIAVNRDFLGYGGELSKTQISDKLRRASCSFVRNNLQYDLKKQLELQDISDQYFSVKVNNTPISTTDPEIIELIYQSSLKKVNYVNNMVKIEVSGRSMNVPTQIVEINSLIDSTFPEAIFTEKPFSICVVTPHRTFIEKLCLLHEEFAKPAANIRSERMSRHLYDVCQIANTPISEEALSDKELYNAVIDHRRRFIGLQDFDYATLKPQMLNIIPPNNVLQLWKEDYTKMQQTMIYGNSLSFEELMKRIVELNRYINAIDW